MMKNRSKKLDITIDSLPTGLENGNIMNGCSSGVNSMPITSIIGISTTFRRKRKFSLVLFVGLSALLCVLYYTNYYPGAVWTLRFGMTSFSNHNNPAVDSTSMLNGLHKSESLGLTSFAGGTNINSASNFVSKPEKFISPPGLDGLLSNRNSGGNANSKTQVLSSLISMQNGGTHDGNHQIGGKVDKSGSKHNRGFSTTYEDTKGGENEAEISSPKTWDWKVWAALKYWKVNLSSSSDEERGEDEFPQLISGEPAEGGSGSVPDIVTTSGRDMNENGNMKSSMKKSWKTMRKVGKSKHSSGRERLVCNFPRLHPFDPSITDFIKSPPAIDCGKSYPLVFRTNFHNKLIKWSHPFQSFLQAAEQNTGASLGTSKPLPNYNCCYKTIVRGNGSDHNVIFSKRCYPIVKTETEIPAAHEFISVRCRNSGTSNQATQQNNIDSSAQKSNASSMSSSDNIDHNGAGFNSNYNNTGVKVYKDILAFVPLKPLVEDRIRKYEESKRKSLYNIHKSRNNKEKGKIVDNLEEKANLVKASEPLNKSQEEPTRYQKAQEGNINLSGGSGDPSEDHYENPPETLTQDGERLSVVVLGLDAQSHMNFIRQMPLTYNFLVKNLSAVGLYGYTKVGDNTFPNVVTLLSGLSVDELVSRCWPTKDSYFDSCPFIWKSFAESGYRTSLAEDSVWMGTFNYEKKGFEQPPTDYYLHPLSLLMAKKIGHETWANAKLCYGPRMAFEVLLDYIVKTAVTFRDSLYFQFVWANSLFHDYLNNPRLGDELLYMTLEFLTNNGYLNNTAFILLSDHGIRWGSIRSTYQGKIEERMPLAYFAFPAWFRRKYPKGFRNFAKNVLRLTTPFDVHETLKDILRLSKGEKVGFDRWSEDDDHNGASNDNKSTPCCSKSSGKKSTNGSGSAGSRLSHSESDEKPPRGISLFRPIPLKRTCKMAGIEEHWCVCHSMQNVPINSTLVQSAAQFVMKVINGLVRKHSQFCAKLSLFKINEAKRKIDGEIDRGLDIDFTVRRNSIGETSSVPSKTDSSPPYTFTPSSGEAMSAVGDKILGGGTERDIKRKSTSSENYQKTEKVSPERKKKTFSVTSSIPSTLQGDEGFMKSLSTSSDIKKMVQLQIVIVTSPGNAVFEATIYGEAEIINRPVTDQNIDLAAGERSNHHWKLSGDISRLNLYGSQSACVTDYTVQKYCYCHNLDVD